MNECVNLFNQQAKMRPGSWYTLDRSADSGDGEKTKGCKMKVTHSDVFTNGTESKQID